MKTAEIRNLLRNDGVAYGTLITAPSPHWVKPLSGIGMDFVFLDTEHISLGPDTLSWMCQACGAANASAVSITI
jgi:4-hydroxy-2-oxoheptanedioate aldolase